MIYFRRKDKQWLFPSMALVVGFLLVAVTTQPFYREWNWRLTDLMILSTGGMAIDERILIVEINERTLSAEEGHGQRLEEWNREIYGRLIERLSMAKPRAVAFDILFLGENAGDSRFRQAVEESPIPILFSSGKNQLTGNFAYPADSLTVAADRLGHVNVQVDRDLLVRRLRADYVDNGTALPALGLLAAAKYWRLPDLPISRDGDNLFPLPTGMALPLDGESNFVINFSTPDSYPTCEFYSLVEDGFRNCPEERIRDKIVFVGWAVSGIGDYYLTPLGAMNGVEIHANLAASILNERLLREESLWLQRLSIVLTALVIGLLMVRLSPMLLLLSEFSALLVAILLCLAFYYSANIRIDIVGPILSMLIVTGVLLATQNMLINREKQQVLTLFQHQASPQIVDALLDASERGELQLGGEERTVSIVFFDMREFSGMAETLPPTQVIQIVNAYLSIIADSLIEQGGTLTSYAGDQVMAIFNAPVFISNHAEQAVRAAQQTMQKLDAYNESEHVASLPQRAYFGAGINSGEVVVGNIGSRNRYSYTVIGDAVNVAARLCSLAPASTIYISGTVVDQISKGLQEMLQVVGTTSLRGRQEKIEIYVSRLASSKLRSSSASRSDAA